MPKFPLTLALLLAALFCAACSPQATLTPLASPVTPTATPPRPSPSSTPPAPLVVPVRLAWFYKPPANGDLPAIVKNFDFFILSKGDELERDQFLALGIEKPLQYVRFDAIMDPGSCTRQPWQNNVAFLPGDFCKISAEHPDWFLLDQNGQRLLETYGGETFALMDPGHPGWRAFFLERLRQTQEADANWSGVFLDNVEATAVRHERKKRFLPAYPLESAYQAAVQGFLSYLRSSYFQPTGRLLFANLIARRDEADWLQSIAALDGVMHEGWAIDWPNGYRSVEVWEEQMTLAEATQAAGKLIVLVSQGKPEDRELQQFAFASYLLVNQGEAVFRFANSQAYNQAWLYDNYQFDLGQALGPRYRQGQAWRRDFTGGYVLVNPETHTVEIQVNP